MERTGGGGGISEGERRMNGWMIEEWQNKRLVGVSNRLQDAMLLGINTNGFYTSIT